MDDRKPTKKSIETAAKNMSVEVALEFIQKQSNYYQINLDSLKDKYQKLYEKYKEEKERLFNMQVYEREGYAKGYTRIGGADEAGRGPLAGPVVAACVILKKDEFIPDINDSKQLSEKKREELFKIITECAVDVGIGISDTLLIDRINILNATKKAFVKAVKSMQWSPDYLLIDALEISELDTNQKSIIKGDTLSISIAAASIIAKVTRDRLMLEYAEKYPQYGFESNKGYGTREHIEAIREHGLCPLHRKLFVRNFYDE